ncbi:hypothetical protein D3C87_161740 [compost metagenome]
MIQFFAALLSLTFLFQVTTAEAQTPFRRLVNFEWEAIENAKSYEIELQQIKEDSKELGKVFRFKTKEAAWNGRLTPGKYIMKLRSRDYRGVPGEWSPPSDFNVGLETAVLKSPPSRSRFIAKESKETTLDFKWDPVGGAESYHFELVSEDGKTQITKDLKETSLKINVPVAQNYTWKVSALGAQGIQSDAVSVGQFTILGTAIETPKISRPESEFVRELKWTRPDNVTSYDLYLLKFNEASKKWDKYRVMQNYQENSLPFDEAWPGGRYQLVLRGKGDLRKNSPIVKQDFRVHSGNRSPAAEYTALVRKSIDRVTGWYGIASYLVTQIQFKGSNPEKNSFVSYNALGGTGRVGAGWFGPDTPWGFLGILDLSGFTFSGKVKTFASLEMNAVYRKSIGDRAELRVQMGPYYKELPETIGLDANTNTSEDTTISAAGPHVGAEYWYSLSPKVGLQVNAHMYMSLLKVSTPNGQPLEPGLSHQIGFLGSYRFTPAFTGLIGYARREDKLSYKAAQSSGSYAEPGDKNEATVTGHYLNIYAEWAF